MWAAAYGVLPTAAAVGGKGDSILRGAPANTYRRRCLATAQRTLFKCNLACYLTYGAFVLPAATFYLLRARMPLTAAVPLVVSW